MHFWTPEALLETPEVLWKLAGGRASAASDYHRISARNKSAPEGAAESPGVRFARGHFPASPPGRIRLVPLIRWCSLRSTTG